MRLYCEISVMIPPCSATASKACGALMTDQMRTVIHSPSAASGVVSQSKVWFDRRELEAILRVYGRLVAEGECRDYAIGAFVDHAVFNMHRSTHPRVRPGRSRSGPSLLESKARSASSIRRGHVLKRGHELVAGAEGLRDETIRYRRPGAGGSRPRFPTSRTTKKRRPLGRGSPIVSIPVPLIRARTGTSA